MVPNNTKLQQYSRQELKGACNQNCSEMLIEVMTTLFFLSCWIEVRSLEHEGINEQKHWSWPREDSGIKRWCHRRCRVIAIIGHCVLLVLATCFAFVAWLPGHVVRCSMSRGRVAVRAPSGCGGRLAADVTAEPPQQLWRAGGRRLLSAAGSLGPRLDARSKRSVRAWGGSWMVPWAMACPYRIATLPLT